MSKRKKESEPEDDSEIDPFEDRLENYLINNGVNRPDDIPFEEDIYDCDEDAFERDTEESNPEYSEKSATYREYLKQKFQSGSSSAQEFLKIINTSTISLKTASKIWDLIQVGAPYVSKEYPHYTSAPCFQTLQRRYIKNLNLPEVKLNAEYKKSNGEIEKLENVSKLRRPVAGEKIIVEVARTSLESTIQFYENLNPNHGKVKEIQFSVDGVRKNKSAGITYQVISYVICYCRKYVIPYAMLKPGKNEEIKDQLLKYVEDLVQECNNLNISIKCLVCDAPMLAFILRMKQFNSKFGCSWCKAKTKAEGGRIGIYDSSTFGSEERDHIEWTKLASKVKKMIDEGTYSKSALKAELMKDEYLSILGESPLLHATLFDIVHQSILDHMHALSLGVMKSLTHWTFKVGEQIDVNGFKRVETFFLDQMLPLILVPSEIGRRTRFSSSFLETIPLNRVLNLES